MCGIAGIINKKGTLPDKNMLYSMLVSIAHRGPDDEGLWFNGNISLGHRRLSIIDTSNAGHQPMHYKNLVITYNGEIYNYIEIKKKLIALGHIFITETDTEVILHAYNEWGKDCLHYFIGMWAFAIFDEKENTLFCSRDRFGIKPFYYYENDNIFAFASEIKAILALNITAKVNYKSLMEYLIIGIHDHSNETFFQGIYQLLPGYLMKVSVINGKMLREKYYDLAYYKKSNTNVGGYIECIKKSVSFHMRSDVRVGTCLSGGLDSSVVAALAASFNRGNGNTSFAAVTAKSESPINDETNFARQVVEKCGLGWFIASPDYKDFAKHIEECLYFQEEPVGGPSVFMQYWVMKVAKESCIKVMLDGQGGDETLLGYERYYIAYFLNLIKRFHFLRFFKEYFLACRHSKVGFFWILSASVYFLLLPIRKKILKRRVRFVKEEYLNSAYRNLQAISKSFFNLDKLQISEIKFYQLPHLLKYEDRNSMAHSIEARVPYVESNCIETALSLLPEEKIRDGYTKFPLRKLAEVILPETIAWRRNKLGFEAPTKMWLLLHKAIMQSEINKSNILKHICNFVPNLQGINIDMQWKLYNIALWERLFNVQI